MKRLLLPLSLVAVVGMLSVSSKSTEACVIDEDSDPDPVAESDLIVAGRITSVRGDYRPDLSVVDTATIPVDVTVSVDTVLKGPKLEELVFRELSGLTYIGDYKGRPSELPYLSWGVETDCGLVGFPSDPTDSYLVIGLRLRSGDLIPRLVFFQGANPSGPEYEEAMHLATPHDFPWRPAAAAAALSPLAFLMGAAFLWRRGESHTG